MDEMTYTVTLTAKELAFRERAREAGIPAIVVSMYAGALQKLVEDEREECAKVCEDDRTQAMEWFGRSRPGGHFAAAIRARGEK